MNGVVENGRADEDAAGDGATVKRGCGAEIVFGRRVSVSVDWRVLARVERRISLLAFIAAGCEVEDERGGV